MDRGASVPRVPTVPRARAVAGALLASLAVAGCTASDTSGGPSPASTAAPPTTPSAAVPRATGSVPSPDAAQTTPSSRRVSAPVTIPGDVDDPASPAVVVNKARPLDPADWAPDALEPAPRAVASDRRLRPEAARAARELFAAAAADGHELRTLSAYRSFAHQQRTYAHWETTLGRAEADRVSARPGHSEHQTGLALDVGDAARPGCDLDACFGTTDAGRWVAAHAAEHGFVVRYPAGAEAVTGYSPEPWHLRWIGRDAARDVMAAGGVLETAWGLPAAPAYPDPTRRASTPPRTR